MNQFTFGTAGKSSMRFHIKSVDDSSITSMSETFGKTMKRIFPDAVDECIKEQMQTELSDRLAHSDLEWMVRLEESKELLNTAKENEREAMCKFESLRTESEAAETSMSQKLKEMDTRLQEAESSERAVKKRLVEVESELNLAEAHRYQLWSNMQKEQDSMDKLVDLLGVSARC